jgi:hypothetical protein
MTEEYSRYLVRSSSNSRFHALVTDARIAADSRYPGTRQAGCQERGQDPWPTPYSFLECASCPLEFLGETETRDRLIATLSEVSPPGHTTFFANVPGGVGKRPLIDGYEGNRSNTGSPRSFIYWRLLRSGFVYQREMHDYPHLMFDLIIDYVARAVDSLVRLHQRLQLPASALRVSFRVVESKNKSAALPWSDSIQRQCDLPELAYDLVQPTEHLRSNVRGDWTYEVVRDLLQQCGLDSPPSEQLRNRIVEALAGCDRVLGAIQNE